jgi:hypothetical protein
MSESSKIKKFSLIFGRFPRGALIQGGVIVHIDPFQKHEQRIGGVLLFWYANPTLKVDFVEGSLRYPVRAL